MRHDAFSPYFVSGYSQRKHTFKQSSILAAPQTGKLEYGETPVQMVTWTEQTQWARWVKLSFKIEKNARLNFLECGG